VSQVVETLVEGGKATPGPPLGPALGPLGVNIPAVVAAINEKTKDFAGMKVPVKVIVDPKTKEFEIEVGTPPTSALILRELGVEKGSSDAKNSSVGNLTMEQVVKIARMKRDGMLASSMRSAVKEVLGTCVSVGVTVEGKHPKEVQKEVDEGKYSELIGE